MACHCHGFIPQAGISRLHVILTLLLIKSKPRSSSPSEINDVQDSCMVSMQGRYFDTRRLLATDKNVEDY